MLDALVPDKIYPKDDGLRAMVGSFSLSLLSSMRDSSSLLESDNPVIFTVLEIEGERISKPFLVGLASEERRDLYLILRGLKGIGRRSALAVLDTGEVLDILRSVVSEDPSLFQTIPGLGAKRVAAIFETLESAYEGSLPKPVPLPVAQWVEIRSALEENGVNSREAEVFIASSSLQGNSEEIYREICREQEL